MASRDEILDAVQALTLETGRLPSLEGVARATGVTKQGVLHYFPNRSALDRAVVLRALDQVEAEMGRAAAGGSPLETYLRLSSPEDADRAAALVVTAALRHGAGPGLPPEVGAAAERWERMIADEVGDDVLAEVVRLTGDGLFSEALVSGASPTAERVERLIGHFRGVAERAR